MSCSVNGESVGGGPAAEPQVVEFGPYRIIGMRYAGKNENGEIPALWDREGGFIARMGEIKTPPANAGVCFGLCRCLPGVTDGSFEYIAALPAAADAPVPDGMVEARIAAGAYAAFPVPSLAGLMEAWNTTGAWMAAHPEWEACCGPGGCDCANHPCFELYPPGFDGQGGLFIYVPVRRRA